MPDPDEVPVERGRDEAEDVSVEFHPSGDALVATVILPPGLRRQDVRLHVSRDRLDLVLRERRLVTLPLPEPVREEDARATLRNDVLDVVMRKAGAGCR